MSSLEYFKKFSVLLSTIILFLLLTSSAQAAIINPLPDDNIGDLFLRIVRAFIGLIGVVATVYFIYGGMVLMTSAGNSEKVQKGKNVIVYAIVGMVLTFTSWQIMMFVIEVLEKST